jgi:CBS domain containing-hemolysin-like protein
MGLLIFYLILAIGFSFLCSVLEAVILSVSPSFVKVKVEKGKSSARLLQSLKNNIDRPLSAILTLNTIAHTVGAAGVGAQAVAVFGEVYFGLISAVLTILILVFSEVIPKTLGARYWRKLALPSARIINVLIYVLYPLVVVSDFFTKLIIRNKKTETVTREEIKVLTHIGAREGVFEKGESKLITNILNIKSIKVKDVLTPRTVVVAAEEEMKLSEFKQHKKYLQFSRIPVFDQSIEDCSAFVLKNDVLENLANQQGAKKLKDIKRNILIIPENVGIDRVFEKLLLQKEHIAMIVDEYGGFEGIVTMEDIIETFLGLEIQDETDTEIDMQKLARKKWEIRAKRMNWDIPDNE